MLRHQLFLLLFLQGDICKALSEGYLPAPGLEMRRDRDGPGERGGRSPPRTRAQPSSGLKGAAKAQGADSAPGCKALRLVPGHGERMTSSVCAGRAPAWGVTAQCPACLLHYAGPMDWMRCPGRAGRPGSRDASLLRHGLNRARRIPAEEPGWLQG